MTDRDHRTGDESDSTPLHGDQDEGERERGATRPVHGDQDEGEHENPERLNIIRGH
jgi:hypothetical protein